MSSSERRIFAPDRPGDAVFVATATILGFACLVFLVRNNAYFADESISLSFTQESWSRLMLDLWSADTHRPYYYALQKAWNEVFGTGRLPVRLLNVTLGALCIPLVYLIGNRLGGRDVARLSAVFLILSPLFVFQSREARMYPLMNLSILAATAALVVLIDAYRHRDPRPQTPGRLVAFWAAFAFAAASAVYAHATAVIFPVLAFLVVVAGVALGDLRGRALRDFLIAGTGLFLLCLPALLPMVFHVRTTLSDFWIPAPSPGWIYSQIAGAYPYPAWAKPLVLLALLWGFRQALLGDRMAFLLLFAFVVLQPLAITALSFVKPILIVRVIVWPTLFAAVVLAFAIAPLRGLWRGAAVAAVLALNLLANRPNYHFSPQLTDFDQLSARLDGFDPRGDALVLGLQDFEYPLRWSHPAILETEILALNYGDRAVVFGALNRSRLIPRAQAADQVITADRLWILSEVNPLFPIPPEDRVDDALATLARGWTLSERTSAGALQLDLYLPGPDGP